MTFLLCLDGRFYMAKLGITRLLRTATGVTLAALMAGCVSVDSSRLRIGVFDDEEEITDPETGSYLKTERTYGITIRWANR
jgi:hypothetical protein